VPRSISIPAFCEGVPVSSEFNTRILSPIFTVFELTVVVVPDTVRSPVTVKLPEAEIFVDVISSEESVPLTVTLLKVTLSDVPTDCPIEIVPDE